MLLADMGARVIKVEQPGRGDDTRAWGPPFLGGESAYFLSINRNKESLTLDLKQPEAPAVPRRSRQRADVLVENFRPGTLERLGLGYDSLAAVQPAPDLPARSPASARRARKRDAPGYDTVMQAEGGLMSITGPAEGRAYRLGVAVARHRDRHAARRRACCWPFIARERPAAARTWTSAMLDSVAALLTYQAGL